MSSDGKTFGVCVLGNGVVGGGVVKILGEQQSSLQARTGVNFEIVHVVVSDATKHKEKTLPFTTDAHAAIDDLRSEIIVELIGGTDIAASLVKRALKLGKPVVTANKSLLAAGPELFALAREHNTCIGFEASCGGGIPIIGALLQGLIANDIHALLGIVNGTCNFILTQMTQKRWSYQQALAEAQKQGFAEANPTLDVSGRDAAQKLAILAGLAFNRRITESDIHVEGIDRLEAVDIEFARELGYVIKLLVVAERSGVGVRVSGVGKNENTPTPTPTAFHPKPETRNPKPDALSLRVHPTLVHHDDMLAEVNGSFNAISCYGDALGHALFYGRGAGRTPTASAVVSDVVGIALGTIPAAFKQLRLFPDLAAPATVLPIDELVSRYYLRLTANDTPGVFAEVTEILGRHEISLSAVLQHENSNGKTVPIIITTHQAREGKMHEALKQIDQLKTITPPSMCLRIIDQPKEFA